eukprot:gene7315-11634_t
MEWNYDNDDQILINKLKNLNGKGIVTDYEYGAKMKLINEKYQDSYDKFQNFLKMGILTQEEYDKSMLKIVKNPPKEQQKLEVKVSSKPTSKDGLSEEDEAKLGKLKSFLDKGILSQEEYDHSVSKIIGILPQSNQTPKEISKSETTPKNSSSNLSDEDQAKLDKLQNLLERGILSQEEYDHSVSKITGSAPPTSKNTNNASPVATEKKETPKASNVKTTEVSGLDSEKQAKLDKLNGLLEKGVLSQKEYDFSVKKLMK